MGRKTPSWWYGRPGPWPILLSPLSAFYGAGAVARFALARPARAPVPVLCIGNLTAGGAGKTPVAIAAARMLREKGERPWLLTRGYGGRARGPVTVDPGRHDAHAVGDEALLLARTAPTVVAADRVAGARHAAHAGASVVVMDDGFQNPSLAKDLSIVVLDGEAGIGNGWVIPSGPLRAPLTWQHARADAFIVVGASPNGGVLGTVGGAGRPTLAGRVTPTGDTAWLKGARVLAFAGIGRPEKLFSTLEGLGATLVDRVTLPDHHSFGARDGERLLSSAEAAKAILVTTEKDHVRLTAGEGVLAELKRKSRPLTVAFVPDDAAAFADLVLSALPERRRG